MSTPEVLYGTAWKENLTEACVADALKLGFRAIDTANQRQHYYEEGVGAALAKAYSELDIQREHLFLQTKFSIVKPTNPVVVTVKNKIIGNRPK